MSSKNSANQMACIDYKAPLGDQIDYRTSSYLAHRYVPDPIHITKQRQMMKKEYCGIFGRKEMQYDYSTEQKTAFTNKFVDNSSDRIPSLMMNTVHYMKPYDELFFTSAPKPIKQFESRYKLEYDAKTLPEEEVPLHWKCPPRVKKSDVVIDPAMPGSSKYLDMLATTNMLTYVVPSSNPLTSTKDVITLWNWLEFTKLPGGIKRELPENISGLEETLCQDFPSQDCPKRREFQTRVKHVPNNGLTTETRDNYVRPEHKVDFIYKDVHAPIQFNTRHNLQKLTTESQMYGSSERIQKYVDVGGLEKKYFGTCKLRY